jgi:hypothetical protein
MDSGRPKLRPLLKVLLASIAVLITGFIGACSAPGVMENVQFAATAPTTRDTTTVVSAQTTPTESRPTEIWLALLERTPFPYTLPLPPANITAIDGTYVKEEPFVTAHVPCRRCPDWHHEAGIWRLRFDKGIYRVLHIDLNWRSFGSYVVSEDRLVIFNDPNCVGDIGVYTWHKENEVLSFQVIDDPCAIQLRGKNLVHLPWMSCQPPEVENERDRWNQPNGC